jgi:hypothetical protein
MTAGEVAHRARVALRDRFAPPAYEQWTPADAFARLFAGTPAEVLRGSRLGALVHEPERDAGAFAAERAAAQALAAGECRVFGRACRIADPPHWNANPWTGAEWPDVPSRDLDYRRADVAGGARFAWELGRLGTLPTLALAARLGAGEDHARRAVRWLDDFATRVPLGRGIQHASGIEMAIRVLNTTWTLALLGERAESATVARALGLAAQQARHGNDHLSLGSSANNHLIAEYAASTTLAAAFPALRDADALLERGLAGLEHETLRQFDADGVNREQALGYLPFIWELLLLPFLAAEAAGRRVSREVRERLARSLEVARALRLPGGRMPQIGDEDDGRVLLLAEDASRLDLVGNALAAWLGADALGDNGHALALLLVGRTAAARAASDGRLDTASLTVWRGDGVHITFDHSPLGLAPLAAHGHADALSVTIFRGSDGLAIDPGTFAYHENRAARDRCRSTPFHNTVHFGGRSQAPMSGPFLWGALPHVHVDATAPPGTRAARCLWVGGEVHERRVSLESGALRLADYARGPAATLVFVLAPDSQVTLDGPRALVECGDSHAVFECEGAGPWRVEPAECAPRFADVRPTQRLAAPLLGERATTTIRLGPR